MTHEYPDELYQKAVDYIDKLLTRDLIDLANEAFAEYGYDEDIIYPFSDLDSLFGEIFPSKFLKALDLDHFNIYDPWIVWTRFGYRTYSTGQIRSVIDLDIVIHYVIEYEKFE